MNGAIVTTSLRMPRDQWLAVKTVAADGGVSVNEFINRATATFIKAAALAFTKPIIFRQKDPIWNWPNLSRKIKMRPWGSLSAEDKIIYDA